MALRCRAELNPWLRYGQLALHVSSCVLHASRLAWCLACKAFRQARSPPQPGLVAAYRASSAATHCLYVPMHRLAQSFVVTVEPPAARLPTPTITIIATTTTATIATTLFLTMGPIPFVALPRCVSPATPHLTHGSSPVLRWSCQIAQILTLRHRHVHCRPWTPPGLWQADLTRLSGKPRATHGTGVTPARTAARLRAENSSVPGDSLVPSDRYSRGSPPLCLPAPGENRHPVCAGHRASPLELTQELERGEATLGRLRGRAGRLPGVVGRTGRPGSRRSRERGTAGPPAPGESDRRPVARNRPPPPRYGPPMPGRCPGPPARDPRPARPGALVPALQAERHAPWACESCSRGRSPCSAGLVRVGRNRFPRIAQEPQTRDRLPADTSTGGQITTERRRRILCADAPLEAERRPPWPWSLALAKCRCGAF